MARKVITTTLFEDDLTGEEVPEHELVTQRFNYDGVTYEIDLSASNAEQFRDEMKKWVTAARRVGGRQKKAAASSSNSSSSSSAKADNTAIREWAHTNGIDVPERGRIPAAVREQYLAAIG